MITVIIQHEVKDFAAWKPVFDADEPNRAEAGIKLQGLYTSLKNPNDVTMIFEAPGTEVFDAFMNNPDLEKAMKEGGVISAPVVTLLNRV